MAKFNRYPNQWDDRGNRISEDELNRLEQEFNQKQQLKAKKMVKLVTSGVIGFFLLIFLFMSCERIDAGHVGVKVSSRSSHCLSPKSRINHVVSHSTTTNLTSTDSMIRD